MPLSSRTASAPTKLEPATEFQWVGPKTEQEYAGNLSSKKKDSKTPVDTALVQKPLNFNGYEIQAQQEENAAVRLAHPEKTGDAFVDSLPLTRPIDDVQKRLEATIAVSKMKAPPADSLTMDAFRVMAGAVKAKKVIQSIPGKMAEDLSQGAPHARAALGQTVERIIERPVKGIVSGLMGTAGMGLRFTQMLGWDAAKKPADKMQEWGKALMPDKPDITDELASAAGSSLAFLVPGMGVMKGAQVLTKVSPWAAVAFGGLASTFLEASVESGGVYEDVLEMGGDEDEAQAAGWRTFAINNVIVGLTNLLGPFGPHKTMVKRALTTMSTESLQEFMQQVTSNVETGRPTFQGAFKSGAFGLILGPVLGVGMGNLSSSKGVQAQPGVQEKTSLSSLYENSPQMARDNLITLNREGILEDDRLQKMGIDANAIESENRLINFKKKEGTPGIDVPAAPPRVDPVKRLDLLKRASDLESSITPFDDNAAVSQEEALAMRREAIPELFEVELPDQLFDEAERVSGLTPLTKESLSTLGEFGKKVGGLQERILSLEKDISGSLPVTRVRMTQEYAKQIARTENVSKPEARRIANGMGNLELASRVVRGGGFPELKQLIDNYETLKSLHDGITTTAKRAQEAGRKERGGNGVRTEGGLTSRKEGKQIRIQEKGGAGKKVESKPLSSRTPKTEPSKGSTAPSDGIRGTAPPTTPPAPPEGISGASELSSKKKLRKFIQTMEKTELTAPEVKKGLSTSPVREYLPITNKDTLAEAQRIIDSSRDDAMGRINKSTAEPDALTVAIGLDMMRRLQNEGGYNQAIDIAEKVSTRATSHGQAIQALAMWGRLTPEGALVAAARKIQEIQDEATGKQGKARKVTDEISDEMQKVNESVVDEVIEDVVPKKKQRKGTPQDTLAQRIIDYTKAKKPKENDPLQDMIQTLLKVAQERIVAPEGVPPRDPLELISQAIRDRENYGTVWNDAKKIVQEKFKDDPKAMDRIEEYLDKPLRSPFARRQVANILQAEISGGEIDIGKLVREHYKTLYNTAEDLRKTLIERSGLTPAEAQDLSIAIQKRFYELTNARKQSILNTMLGERVAVERKTEAQRIIELSNLGAFEFESTQRLVGEKLGLPELTPEIARDITELANNVQESPEGSRKHIIATNLLLRYIDELRPSSLGAKASLIQTISMIVNLKTFIRNLGSATQIPAEAAVELVAYPLDAGISMLRGSPRTRAMPAWIKGNFVGLKGFKRGLSEGFEEALLGIDTRATTSRYLGSSPRGRRVFTSGLLKHLETALKIELMPADRAFFERAVDISLDNQMRAAGTTTPNDAMLKRAAYDGARAIFEQESILKTVFVGIKKILNIVGVPEAGVKAHETKSFGLGDFTLKFPGIPANLINIGLEFSPMGYMKTVLEAAKPMFTGKEFDQREFVDSFARATVGTTGLLMTGYQLARIGVLTGAPEEDSEINAVYRWLGTGQYKINRSALYRYILSGFDPEAGKKQDGDILHSFDWFQPFAIGLSMGANVFFSNDKVSALSRATSMLATILSSVEASVRTIEEQPLLQSLRRITQGNKSTLARLGNALKDAPATFIPTFINQITQFKDNVSRETYDPNILKEMANKVQAKIPGLSSRLPPRINPATGKVQLRYQNDTNTFFNVFINPSFITVAIKDPAMQEVIGIYERTGDARGAPRVVPKSINVNGQKKKLTGVEIATYQQYVAKEMRFFYDTIIQTPQWEQAGDDARADELQKILNGINQAAKIQLFGDRPRSPSGVAKSILFRRGFKP